MKFVATRVCSACGETRKLKHFEPLSNHKCRFCENSENNNGSYLALIQKQTFDSLGRKVVNGIQIWVP